MKKWIKYIGITFAVLIGIGILGNLLGVEPAQKQIEAESKEELAKAEAEKDAEEKAKELKEEQEEAKAKEEQEAKEEAARTEKAEKEAKEAAEKAEEEANAKAELIAKEEAKQKDKGETHSVTIWEKEIATLAANSDAVADKFYALEKFLISHKVTNAEVKEFSATIVSDYKSGNYLSDIRNHERMLTNILKSYYVEKNSKGALKDFAFDYFQNMKNTYRGVEAVDSSAVKANEDQMNKALSKM